MILLNTYLYDDNIIYIYRFDCWTHKRFGYTFFFLLYDGIYERGKQY